MVDRNPLSIFDQLLVASLFIPAAVTLIALAMVVVTFLCTVILAPFGAVAMWVQDRGDEEYTEL